MELAHPLSVALVLAAGQSLPARREVLDLRRSPGGVKVLRSYSGRPDKRGVMAQYELLLPSLGRTVYYVGGWWPAGGNRVCAKHSPPALEGGLFMVVELRAGGSLAVLPLCGDLAYCWFAVVGGEVVLRMGTHGKEAIRGDVPLCAWARGADPYEASHKAWKAATRCEQIAGWLKLRSEKAYPEVFRYLGWCSWEQYKKGIDERNMVRAMKDIEASGVPIRFFLVDDGHFDSGSLAPHESRFPNGYKPLTALRRPDGIKWVGIWYAFLGANHGIVARKAKLGDVRKHMDVCHAGKLLPKPTEQDARAFYEYMTAFAGKDGVDFLKVDFQTDALPFYAGTPQGNPIRGFPHDNATACGNPLAAAANAARVFQAVVEQRFGGLINCNWHNAVSVFNTKNSVTGRCSADYRVGSLTKARSHLHDSCAATPWLGQTAWPDHDMFHSSDKFAGRMMAVSKAISGGPVYLSDAPTQFKPDVIGPLCYEDGLLLRPLAPAGPVDIFQPAADPADKKLFKGIAPLPNGAAAIVAYNFNGEKKGVGETVSGHVTAADYPVASGMIQPYPGPWTLPAEGLAVYDWYARKARKLRGKYAVAITGFGDRLIQLSPVKSGWSVIGRTDKYLSAAAVEIVSCRRDKLVVKLHESGPLGVWSAAGRPEVDGSRVTDEGNGLFKVHLRVKAETVTVTINRTTEK